MNFDPYVSLFIDRLRVEILSGSHELVHRHWTG